MRSKPARMWDDFCELPGIVRFGVYLVVAIVLMLCFPSEAKADLVLHNDDKTQELRLYASLCTHAGTMAHIPAEFRARFQNARILDPKGTIQAYGCWAEQDEDVLIVFEDGSRTDFRLSKLRESVI